MGKHQIPELLKKAIRAELEDQDDIPSVRRDTLAHQFTLDKKTLTRYIRNVRNYHVEKKIKAMTLDAGIYILDAPLAHRIATNVHIDEERVYKTFQRISRRSSVSDSDESNTNNNNREEEQVYEGIEGIKVVSSDESETSSVESVISLSASLPFPHSLIRVDSELIADGIIDRMTSEVSYLSSASPPFEHSLIRVGSESIADGNIDQMTDEEVFHQFDEPDRGTVSLADLLPVKVSIATLSTVPFAVPVDTVSDVMVTSDEGDNVNDINNVFLEDVVVGHVTESSLHPPHSFYTDPMAMNMNAFSDKDIGGLIANGILCALF